jgi:hypothetical protein
MSNNRVYTVVISGTASPAAAFDLFEFNAAAAKPIRLVRLKIAQTGEPTSEEEQLGINIIRSHSTSGSGGTAPTPAPLNVTDAAAGFGAEVMNTTQATGGSPITLVSDAWNTRAGLDIAFAPEEGPEAPGGGRLVVACTIPADAVTIRATAWVEEMG